MSPSDIIAVIAAFASWIAVLLQWQAQKVKSTQFDERIHHLQLIIERIDQEKTTRERDIKERKIAHSKLAKQNIMTDHSRATARKEMLLRDHIILFQSFALFYLNHKELADQKDESIAQIFDEFSLAIGSYYAKQNYAEQLFDKGDLDGDELIKEAARRTQLTVNAYARAIEEGKNLMSKLEEIEFLKFPVGLSIHTKIQPLSVLRSSIDDLLKNLSKADDDIQ